MGNTVKPTQLKKLEGTYRSDRAVQHEMNTGIIKVMPDPPRSMRLTPGARAVWRELGPQLVKIRMIQEADLMAFGELCSLSAYMLDCRNAIRKAGGELFEVYTNKAGHQNRVQSIHFRNYLAAYKPWSDLCRQFGLTPSARARLSMPDVTGQTSLMDLLEVVR